MALTRNRVWERREERSRGRESRRETGCEWKWEKGKEKMKQRNKKMKRGIQGWWEETQTKEGVEGNGEYERNSRQLRERERECITSNGNRRRREIVTQNNSGRGRMIKEDYEYHLEIVWKRAWKSRVGNIRARLINSKR